MYLRVLSKHSMSSGSVGAVTIALESTFSARPPTSLLLTLPHSPETAEPFTPSPPQHGTETPRPDPHRGAGCGRGSLRAASTRGLARHDSARPPRQASLPPHLRQPLALGQPLVHGRAIIHLHFDDAAIGPLRAPVRHVRPFRRLSAHRNRPGPRAGAPGAGPPKGPAPRQAGTAVGTPGRPRTRKGEVPPLRGPRGPSEGSGVAVWPSVAPLQASALQPAPLRASAPQPASLRGPPPPPPPPPTALLRVPGPEGICSEG